MNVENRKLFRNKDARSRLASMGGIMGSSPELLGTVQKFQEGGEIKPTPVSIGNAMFYIDMQTGTVFDDQGAMINDPRVIDVVSIKAAQMAQAPSTEGVEQIKTLDTSGSSALDDLRAARANIATTEGVLGPSSALDDLRAARANIATTEMFGTGDQQAPQQQVGEPVRDSSGNLLPVAEPVYEQTARRIADSTGISSLPVTSALDDLRAAQAVANVSDGSAGLGAAEILAAGENYLFGPRDFEPRFPGDVPPDLNPPSEDKPLSEMSDNELKAMSAASGLSIPELTELYVVDPVINAGRSFRNAFKNTQASLLSKVGAPELAAAQYDSIDALNADTAKKRRETNQRIKEANLEQQVFKEELDSRVLNPEVGGPEVTSEDIDKAVEETEKEKAAIKTTRSFDANKIIKDRETAAAKFADEEVNPQGPNFVFDPAKIQEEIDLGGSGSDSIIGDITGTKQNLTPKESVKAYQAMYKEMLGMDDEDEEKEKWHQMAMIGFAIAAGQDPNALSNIAGGLLEGTKMAKKDRARKQDRKDKFTMMAIQSADEDRRTALAAGVRADERAQDQLNRIALTDLETRQRLIDEGRKSKQSLQLYEDKLKIAQMFETPDSILKTDPALANIKQAYEGVDYDMLGTGETAFSALEKMGFPRTQLKRFSAIVFPGEPYGGSADVGKGVTGTGSTLVFE